MKRLWLYLSLVTSVWGASQQNVSSQEFPPDFKIGIATSAYQIEGGWNESGKIYIFTSSRLRRVYPKVSGLSR